MRIFKSIFVLLAFLVVPIFAYYNTNEAIDIGEVPFGTTIFDAEYIFENGNKFVEITLGTNTITDWSEIQIPIDTNAIIVEVVSRFPTNYIESEWVDETTVTFDLPEDSSFSLQEYPASFGELHADSFYMGDEYITSFGDITNDLDSRIESIENFTGRMTLGENSYVNIENLQTDNFQLGSEDSIDSWLDLTNIFDNVYSTIDWVTNYIYDLNIGTNYLSLNGGIVTGTVTIQNNLVVADDVFVDGEVDAYNFIPTLAENENAFDQGRGFYDYCTRSRSFPHNMVLNSASQPLYLRSFDNAQIILRPLSTASTNGYIGINANSIDMTGKVNFGNSITLGGVEIFDWSEIGTDLFTLNQSRYILPSEKFYNLTIGYRDSTNSIGMYGLENGYGCEASGNYSHAEGYETVASGLQSHSEGYSTVSSGRSSHAEGIRTVASGEGAHSEGTDTIASGSGSWATGFRSIASNSSSFVWNGDWRFNYNSHGTGSYNINPRGGITNFWIGETNFATYLNSVSLNPDGEFTSISLNDESITNWSEIGQFIPMDFVQKTGDVMSGLLTNTVGITVLGTFNNGNENTTGGNYSHAEGTKTTANGNFSHSEGQYTTANGQASHAEGQTTRANGETSHTEGTETIANGQASHAEGFFTTAQGAVSHAEGNGTLSLGKFSHAEGKSAMPYVSISAPANSSNVVVTSGYVTTYGFPRVGQFLNYDTNYCLITGINGNNISLNKIVSSSALDDETVRFITCSGGDWSHSEGIGTTSAGIGSHSEGYYTSAMGDYSHVDGTCAITTNKFSYTWSGFFSTNVTNNYYSHGDGTYNVNPINGIEGYYVGEQTLHQHIRNTSHQTKIVTEPFYAVTEEDDLIWADAEYDFSQSQEIYLQPLDVDFSTVVIRRLGQIENELTPPLTKITVTTGIGTETTISLTTDGQTITADWIKEKHKWYIR